MLDRIRRINERLAVAVTAGVGTMWCAYAFAVLALVSLPGALKTHDVVVIVGWVAQTFLQLVLLSVLMVGQQRGADWVAATLRDTHDATLKGVAGIAELVAELHTKHDALRARLDDQGKTPGPPA